jgi:hypothetical protein
MTVYLPGFPERAHQRPPLLAFFFNKTATLSRHAAVAFDIRQNHKGTPSATRQMADFMRHKPAIVKKPVAFPWDNKSQRLI